MRAAVFHGRRDVRIEQVDDPVPGPGELLLRIHATGICGTDGHEYGSGPHMFPIAERHPVTGHVGPMVPGHELAGTVVDAGPGVDGFSDGTLVVSGAGISCGSCHWCTRGQTNLCSRYATVGLQRHGGLAQYCAVPAATCLDAASYGLAPDAAALGQPMSIAVHATRRGRVEEDETAVILGAGGIGAFMAYVVSALGAVTVVSDLDPERLAIAASLGANHTVQPGGDTDLSTYLADHELIPSVVYEVTGTTAGLADARAVLPRGSRLVLVGLQSGPAEIELRQLSLHELEVIGTNAHVLASDLPEALRLLAARDTWSDIAPMALSLDDLVADGLAPLADGSSTRIKTIVDPWAETSRPTQTDAGSPIPA